MLIGTTRGRTDLRMHVGHLLASACHHFWGTRGTDWKNSGRLHLGLVLPAAPGHLHGPPYLCAKSIVDDLFLVCPLASVSACLVALLPAVGRAWPIQTYHNRYALEE